MPLYKNWNDFDTLRDKNKVLVIYGAGYMGLSLLNDYEIIPDFFCDKNARIKKIAYCSGAIPCLTLKQILAKLKERDADILISNMDGKVIKSLHKIFDKTKFTENTVIYFHNDYNIANRDFISRRNPFFKINGIVSVPGFYGNYDIYKRNFNPEIILKSAYFNVHFSSIDEFEIFRKNRKVIIQFQKGRILCKLASSNIYDEPKKLVYNKTIYFFCDSRFMNSFCKDDYGIESMLLSLLNNRNYKIENYSITAANNEKIIFQLTNVPLAQNSIVIVNSIHDPYLLTVAKLYCKKYNCRLLFYYVPTIYSRKKTTDYEKWCIRQFARSVDPKFSDEKFIKKIKLVAKAMNIEFYEPPDIFFNLNKTIFLDTWHFGDYGNEIIAKHLSDIITNPPVNSNNELCENFHIEPEEKIEYAGSVIPLLVPDIPIYLNDLKKHKQNLENCGAIVMNCNPFTLGHRYLIEHAASKAEHLFIFVVEEDKSEFSFKDRYKLVKQNTDDLKNVTVLPSGKFIISSQTFDAYFGKSSVSEEQAIEQDVSFDLLIFAAAIAPTLNIKTRFVGQEPFDPLTRHYNEEMKKLLPEYGCGVVEIPRLEKDGGAVSASRVRKFLKDGNFEEIKKIVPEETFRYLKKNRENPKA